MRGVQSKEKLRKRRPDTDRACLEEHLLGLVLGEDQAMRKRHGRLCLGSVDVVEMFMQWFAICDGSCPAGRTMMVHLANAKRVLFRAIPDLDIMLHTARAIIFLTLSWHASDKLCQQDWHASDIALAHV